MNTTSDSTASTGSPANASISFPPVPSSNNAALSAPSQPPAANDRLPPALTVRLGVMRRIFLAASGMDERRRWRLGFTTVVGACQVIAFIVILATSYRKPCDQNLGLYLILLIVRIALSFPTALWSAISPRHSRRDPPERRDELERNRLIGNQRIDHRLKKLSDLVSLYGLIIFPLGNIWLISSNTCSATNPILYKGALAAVILSWLWILEFFILCALALFFLPILLYGMRHWGWGEKKHEVGPLKKHDISKLPRRIFVGTLSEDSQGSTVDAPETASGPTVSPSSQAASEPSTKKSRWQFWRLWRSSRSASDSSPSSSSDSSSSSSSWPISMFPPFPSKTLPIKLPESQNACSICLSEYEMPPLKSSPDASKWEPEILLLLPCRHAFHETCLVDWLAVSGRCALCQTPVFPPKPSKGDKATPSNSSSTTTNPSSTAPTSSTTTATTSQQDTEIRPQQYCQCQTHSHTIPTGEGEDLASNNVEDRSRTENLV
ncbi:uncharacterized protein JCM6883_007362 [Sporobolomyces salmoneus]|uniref:uncharacterized protein n=1 Tax=Sporobolomyces salmoneus TaxID=183962 RepID=UPI00317AD21C